MTFWLVTDICFAKIFCVSQLCADQPDESGRRWMLAFFKLNPNLPLSSKANQAVLEDFGVSRKLEPCHYYFAWGLKLKVIEYEECAIGFLCNG